jgi:hypothetical protein
MRITRRYIKEHLDTIFVFGDNIRETGLGGQAKEARGEKNTIGIPTKWVPNNNAESFFSDNDYNKIIPCINKVFHNLKFQRDIHGFKIVFFPNIGEGLAELPTRAPKIYQYIKDSIENFR